MAPISSIRTGMPSSSFLLQLSSKMNEITHELEELGAEIKPQVMHKSEGFENYKGSHALLEKLRHAMHEKDKLFHEAIQELEQSERRFTSMAALQSLLEKIHQQLNETRTYQKAWEVAEQEMNGEHRHRKEQKERDEMLKSLQKSLEHLEANLKESNALTTVWKTTEFELEREMKLREEEHDSVRKLLWMAVKVTGRRIKKGLLWLIPFRGKK
jgi:chromosome segregation ATPase